jgi:hypothetical protein
VRLALLAEAEAELGDAAARYDDHRVGLGDELLIEVGDALAAITEMPETWPRWPAAPARVPPVRRFVLARFPYSIAYQVHSDVVVILAVVHTHRKPFYWFPRAR